MKEKLRNVTQMVWYCLDRYPDTRGDDRRLIEILYDEFYGVWDDPFYKVVNRKDLPSFETIRRARQKIQQENEDLRADKATEDLRLNVQKDYIEYARGEERWI